ncbi:hypothetical protein [Nostoc paludosum]
MFEKWLAVSLHLLIPLEQIQLLWMAIASCLVRSLQSLNRDFS